MTNTLKQLFHERVGDPTVSGLLIETELEPIAGKATPVAPPTYAGAGTEDKKVPTHAFTPEAFVPAPDEHGWYAALQSDPQTGAPRLAPRVVYNSFAAESGRAETSLWNGQQRLGITLPAILVDGREAAAKVAASNPRRRQLEEALDFALSTWQLAHRQNDAWLRYAVDDAQTQIWQQDENDPASLKHLITAAGAKRGDLLYRYFPNSAIYGFWLSSGVAARHKLPRAYSSEIIGYGARAVSSGATKLDATGGAPNSIGVERDASGGLTLAKKLTKQNRPSLSGFGLVPSTPLVRTYASELILQQSTLSLAVLRTIRFETEAQSRAALTVLALLAATGHVLAGQDGFLRSSAALNPVEQRWGWRRQGVRHPELLATPSVDDLAAALREAIDDAEQLGLGFAPTITVRLSPVEQALIEQRVTDESSSVESEPSES